MTPDERRRAIKVWESKLRDGTLSREQHEHARNMIRKLNHEGSDGKVQKLIERCDELEKMLRDVVTWATGRFEEYEARIVMLESAQFVETGGGEFDFSDLDAIGNGVTPGGEGSMLMSQESQNGTMSGESVAPQNVSRDVPDPVNIGEEPSFVSDKVYGLAAIKDLPADHNLNTAPGAPVDELGRPTKYIDGGKATYNQDGSLRKRRKKKASAAAQSPAVETRQPNSITGPYVDPNAQHNADLQAIRDDMGFDPPPAEPEVYSPPQDIREETRIAQENFNPVPQPGARLPLPEKGVDDKEDYQPLKSGKGGKKPLPDWMR